MDRVKTIRNVTFVVTYFKPSGEYYTTGYFNTDAETIELGEGRYKVFMDNGVRKLKSFLNERKAPGLPYWESGVACVISHEGGNPTLIK
jgi:hypothetical protein